MSNRVKQRRNWQRKIKVEASARRLDKKDLISELPDDVLIHILSFLTMKEAGRTSVLSERWRHVWSHIPTLNFPSRMQELKFCSIAAIEAEGLKYYTWVDQVVSSHKALTVDEFRVGFIMTSYLTSSKVDKWIRFAMDKRVKMLEVHLPFGYGPEQHTFPSLAYSNRLTSLELGYMNVTGEVLESCLRNCPALESVIIKCSASLVELTVTGPSLKLKFLRIYRCLELKKLEISAPNLVSFHYIGRKTPNMKLDCMPKLREVTVGDPYVKDLEKCFSDLSSNINQIEVLRFEIEGYLNGIELPFQDYVFTRLKKLELVINPYLSDEIHCLASIIQAAPFIHHLILMVSHMWSDEEALMENREELMIPDAFPHQHLRIVEFVGFSGSPIDVEIATFVIECAVSLDKFSFDIRQFAYIGSSREFQETPVKQHARTVARQLGRQMKQGTQLEILH